MFWYKSVVSTKNFRVVCSEFAYPIRQQKFPRFRVVLWFGITYTRERGREHCLRGYGNGKSENSATLANDDERVSRGGGQFCTSQPRRNNGSSCSDPAESTRILQGLTTVDSAVLRRIPRDGRRGRALERETAPPRRRGSAWFTTELCVGERVETILTICDRWPENYRGDYCRDAKWIIFRARFLLNTTRWQT